MKRKPKAPKFLSGKLDFTSIVRWLVAAAVAASLMLNLSTYVTPIVRYYGRSMSPTLTNNQLLLMNKLHKPRQGDIIAFYYNNNVMISRVIATGSQNVEVDVFGKVTVNYETLQEPYVTQAALGQTDLVYPYPVPAGSYFVMGDDREISMDSRLEKIGCVSEDSIIGTAVFSLWPLAKPLK